MVADRIQPGKPPNGSGLSGAWDFCAAYDPKAVDALPAADEAEQGATRARTGLETAAAHPVNRAVMSSQKGRFRCYFNGLMGFALRG